MRLSAVLVSLLLLQGCIVPVPIPVGGSGTAPAANPGAEDAAGQAINAYRKAHKLKPVSLNPTLVKAARAQSQEMEAMNKMVHVSRDGTKLKGRLIRVGYRPCAGAENIAEGYTEPTDVVTRWYGSPGHKRNMLLPNVREYGFATSGKWATLILASRC